MKELIQLRATQVEVHESNSPSGTRKRRGQVRGSGRLSVSFQGARDHDDPRGVIRLTEFEIYSQYAHRFRVGALWSSKHRELIRFTQATRRLGQPAEERQPQLMGDLFSRSNPRILCLCN